MTKTEMNKLNLNNNVYNKMTKAHKILTMKTKTEIKIN